MSDQTPRPRWGALLIPAATFLVGLLIGGLLIGVGSSSGGDAAGTPPENGTSPGPSATTAASAAPGQTVVTVPAACRQAADKLREATSLLRRSVGDVREFKANRIVDALNRLEDLDQQTRPLVEECSKVDVDTGATPVPSSSPTGS